MLVLKPEDTRIKNAVTLLHILLKNEGISRVELSRMTGLTKTTVSSIVRDFMSLGIVEESLAITTGNVGKSPTPLYIKANAVHTIGVHLGRERVRIVLMDARMNIIFKKKEMLYTDNETQSILEKLFSGIESTMKEAKKHGIEVGTIGIGIPGPLNAQTGVVKQPPKFKGWKDVPLGKIVHEKYHLPTWIENDANVGALAEKWYGGGKQIKNFMYVLANEGIGAGIIIDDELYQGAFDYVGEIGHNLFYEHGKFKYLEDIAGADLLIKRARSKGLKVKTINDISKSLKTQEGRKTLNPIIEEAAVWMGSALLNAVHVIGPQTVFVGGKMSVLGDALIQPIREIFSRYLFGEQKVDVMLSKIPEDAVTVGAAIYATTKWLENKSIEHVKKGRNG